MQEREKKQAEVEAARLEQERKEAWISELIKSQTPSWKRELTAQLQKKNEPTPPPAPVPKGKPDPTAVYPDLKPQIKLF